ncbi:37710_t:CDS:2, partial [Gigaspora margarita]
DSFEKGILYAAKKNILHKKLKKGAPNNMRSNKFDKNSASGKSVRGCSNKFQSPSKRNYRLEIMLSSDFLAEDSLAKIKEWWFILNK